MDPENQALCYFYRNPPAASGSKPLPYRKIAPLVFLKERDEDGELVHPSCAAVFKCVQQWTKERKKRGRQKGWRNTTRADDQQILKTFRKVRKPLGKKVYARFVRAALPKAVRTKVCVRTVRQRLAEKGIKPERKLRKSNYGPAWRKRRNLWCAKHKNCAAVVAEVARGCRS